MKKCELVELLQFGREIEFKYNGKMYSLTQGPLNGKNVISFCEFYKETTEVENAEDALYIERAGITVLQMWESISEDDVWIF